MNDNVKQNGFYFDAAGMQIVTAEIVERLNHKFKHLPEDMVVVVLPEECGYAFPNDVRGIPAAAFHSTYESANAVWEEARRMDGVRQSRPASKIRSMN